MTIPQGIVDQYDSSQTTPAVRLVPAGFNVLAYTSGVAMVPNAALGLTWQLTVTDNVAFSITTPTNAKNGMRLSVKIKNTSGGAHGAGTFTGTFKPAAAVPAIANGSNRTFEFIFDGTNWVEDFRSAADVAN